MMNYPSIIRNHRPKGFKVKQALQFSFLFAVCIWLLYQFRHSYDKREEYVGSIQNKLSEEYSGVILGRKGNAGWSSKGAESDMGGVNAVGEGEMEEDGGAGDDELDRSAEEKTEEESFHTSNKFRRGNFTSHGEKEDEKGPKTQYKESQNNGEIREGDGNSHRNVSDNDEQGEDRGRQVSRDEQGDEDPEALVQETQETKEDNADTPVRDKDETVGSYKENDEDKEPTKNEEKIAMQPSVMENATVHGQSEMENTGILGFHDENGVPQDGSSLIESMPVESNGDQASTISQKTISSLNNQSRIIENMPEVEEVATKEGSNTSEVETESKSIPEDSKNETTNDAEINSEANIHTATSSI